MTKYDPSQSERGSGDSQEISGETVPFHEGVPRVNSDFVNLYDLIGNPVQKQIFHPASDAGVTGSVEEVDILQPQIVGEPEVADDIKTDYVFSIVDPNLFRKNAESSLSTEKIQFFGQNVLEQLAILKEWETMPVMVQTGLVDTTRKKISKEIKNVRSNLARLCADNPALAATLDRYPVEQSLKSRILTGGNKSIAQGILEADEDVFVDFLLWNKDYVDARRVEYDYRCKIFIDQFRTDLMSAIDRGLPLTKDQVAARLDSVSLQYADPLVLFEFDAGGLYDVYDDRCYISFLDDIDKEKRIAYHELLHHLSGKDIIRVGDEAYPESELLASYHVVRLGYSVITDLSNRSQLFRWFNEAVTEHLTQILLQSPDFNFEIDSNDYYFQKAYSVGSYQNERVSMLHLLRTIGLSFGDMLAAYFSDLKPDRWPEDDPLYHPMIVFKSDMNQHMDDTFIELIGAMDKNALEALRLHSIHRKFNYILGEAVKNND